MLDGTASPAVTPDRIPGARAGCGDAGGASRNLRAQCRALLTVSDLSNMVQGTCAAPPTCSRCRRSPHLDFGLPVAIGLLAVLHFVPDAGDPAGAVACLRDAERHHNRLGQQRLALEAGQRRAEAPLRRGAVGYW